LQGRQGLQGTQGTQGLQGTLGSQGTQGLQGTLGSQGTQGLQGTLGSQGTQGLQGTLGSQGTQGLQGLTGPVAGSANQVVYKDGTNTATGSANLTFNGTTLTATQIDLSANGTVNDSVLYLSGTPTSSSGTNGLLGIGQLSFSDTDIIANFVHSVNSYAQIVVQNKNSGSTSSADVVVNNDRAAGTTYFGDFGINGTTFAGGGPFGDPDGTYLYSSGGTLTLGSQGAHNVKVASNNTERITILSTGNVGIRTTNPGSTLDVFGDIGIRATDSTTQKFTINFNETTDSLDFDYTA